MLVTGGLGFIGSNFIRYMLNKYEDISVINLDKLSVGSNPANLKDIEMNKRYTFVKGDIADKQLVEKLNSKVDVVVNIAAETHVDRSIVNPWPFIQSNTVGAMTFVEKDALEPSSPYSASKAAADLFALACHRTYGLDVVIARCTNNYGPFQFPEKFIPKTIIRASLNLPIPLYGEGVNIRDWIYVLDFCEALNLLLEKGKIGEIYNISAGNELKNIDVAKNILKIMGKSENLITFVEDRPGHDVRYSLDSSKIHREIGWKPKYNFKEALKQTVDWYVNNNWWWTPLITEKTIHTSPWKLKG
jgi:dTDP-glucose 4,6-dehydratase